MNSDSFLLIGEAGRPEFRPIAARLAAEGKLAGTACRRYASLRLAGKDPAADARLVILLESRPGEYPPKETARFRRHLPEAVFLLIAGQLCEGEGRTGRLPAGTVRRYHYEFETAVLPELIHFFHRQPNRFFLPATATEEDYWRSVSLGKPHPETLPFAKTDPEEIPSGAVIAVDPGMRELLADLETRRFGRTAALSSFPELRRLDAAPRLRRIVIDLTQPPLSLVPLLTQAAGLCPEAEFVIHAFAPKPDETAAFRAAAERVSILPKPFALLETPRARSY